MIGYADLSVLLTTRHFGRKVVFLPCVGSTNDVARDLARRGAAEGTVVLADEQTSGRGRMGRRWLAPRCSSILCSLIFRPSCPPEQFSLLTMLCSLAAADAIEQQTGLRVALKWPNDLIICSSLESGWRKLAGVLTEADVFSERPAFVIVGIGINVNIFPRDLPALAPDATSIFAETGRWTDRTHLVAAFLTEVERRYELLKTGHSPFAEWQARLATLGNPVQATLAGEVLTGVAEGVTEDGALLLRTPAGTLHRLLAADVTLAPPAGVQADGQGHCLVGR
ncbi:MAG: biotin--[acetyl-CoA-carboxylase] ligase [Anaerolineae bacterium]|nr:biotin--[acetyl-CoA-carboxylase] ligase [Anaerolineae bacterium]